MKVWFYIRLYIVLGNELRCGCHWAMRYGMVIRDPRCKRHDW
ncbi:hypothetical protein ACIBEJ_00850 [Nonomuraea sp. NPDC050790]